MGRRLSLIAAVVLAVASAALGASAPSGTITTVAELHHPRSVAVLPDGGFLVAQPYDNTVRRVAADGSETVVAGTGEAGYSGDGGPATAAELNFVHAVALMPDGGFVLADTHNDSIRRVTPDGVITTVAGVGSAGFRGDGGPATAARLWAPHGVSVRPDGSLLIADTNNNRIRLVSTQGIITTVAGTGQAGYSGDGGPAITAELDRPFDVASLPDGGFLIADGNRVRRVDGQGTITTVAGSPDAGYAGDGGPAQHALLSSPHNFVALADGGLLIADTGNSRIRRISPDGTITTVAGTGVAGFAGDGGAADRAQLDLPKAVALLANGKDYLVADAGNNRVRLVHIAPAPLMVTIPPALRSRRGSAAQLRVTLSDGAELQLDVLRGAQRVLRVRAARSAGSSLLLFGRTLARGKYELRLSATTADGRHAVARGKLVVRQ